MSALPRRPAARAGGTGTEIYFSIVQRKAIATGDFADLDNLAARILAFPDRYNATASPFEWKYTRTDLNNYLTRLRRHNQHAPAPALAQAA